MVEGDEDYVPPDVVRKAGKAPKEAIESQKPPSVLGFFAVVDKATGKEKPTNLDGTGVCMRVCSVCVCGWPSFSHRGIWAATAAAGQCPSEIASKLCCPGGRQARQILLLLHSPRLLLAARLLRRRRAVLPPASTP